MNGSAGDSYAEGAPFENVPVWEQAGTLTLPRLAGEVHADVCVVGLGGSGLSAVLELLELGKSVVGVDAGPVAGGAAGRNGGLLLAGLADFHHDTVAALGRERAVALYQLSLDALALEVEGGLGGAERVGSLRIAASAAELVDCRAQLEQMRADGLPVEPYRGPEGEGLLFPEDAVVNPLERCRELARRALELGAQLYQDSPVTSVSSGRVECAASVAGEPPALVRCSAVIVAIDGRLEQLLPELAPRVRTARLQMLATEPTDELLLTRPVYRRYGFEYYQRTAQGRIALGGFRDLGGEEESTDSEWTSEAVPTRAVQSRLERFLREELRVTAAITHRWAASVGYSAGPLPLREEVRPGVWAVGGYSGTGNLIGAVLGRASARVVCGLPSRAWELFG